MPLGLSFNCDVIDCEVGIFNAHSGQSGSIVCSPNARAMDQAYRFTMRNKYLYL